MLSLSLWCYRARHPPALGPAEIGFALSWVFWDWKLTPSNWCAWMVFVLVFNTRDCSEPPTPWRCASGLFSLCVLMASLSPCHQTGCPGALSSCLDPCIPVPGTQETLGRWLSRFASLWAVLTSTVLQAFLFVCGQRKQWSEPPVLMQGPASPSCQHSICHRLRVLPGLEFGHLPRHGPVWSWRPGLPTPSSAASPSAWCLCLLSGLRGTPHGTSSAREDHGARGSRRNVPCPGKTCASHELQALLGRSSKASFLPHEPLSLAFLPAGLHETGMGRTPAGCLPLALSAVREAGWT